MKYLTLAALAITTLAAASQRAEACNPMLNPNYGKHVAPSALPVSMLAANAPAVYYGATIVGLWHDVHTASDGTLFLEGYDTWNSDGTENELGNLPPAGGNLCVGAWHQNGRIVNLTSHVAWVYDLNNNYIGPLLFTEQNIVSGNGFKYTGTFDAKFFDTNGNVLHEITGTTTADRLR